MSGIKSRVSVGNAAIATIVVVVWLLALTPGAYAETYLVGGSTQQWKFASNGYNYDANWTPEQTFYVNDVLEFNYMINRHNVVELGSKEEYDVCSGTPLQTWQSGDDLVMLNSAGTKYYICGLPGHCQAGMKVSVAVVDDMVGFNDAHASPLTTTPIGALTSPPSITVVDAPATLPISTSTGASADPPTNIVFPPTNGPLTSIPYCHHLA